MLTLLDQKICTMEVELSGIPVAMELDIGATVDSCTKVLFTVKEGSDCNCLCCIIVVTCTNDIIYH